MSTRLLRSLLLFLACALPMAAARAADAERPDVVLHGELTGKDNQTYRPLPFDVPAGVTRITVQFDYTGREEKTTVDLGLLGPDGFRGQDGFRGWSGGTKKLFTVSATDATPSYLPGAIRPGRWQLLLGIPNIRPQTHATYTASIWFGHAGDPAWEPAVLNPPLRQEAGWYRGDLHMHTAHSDGGCKSQSGAQRVPCPLFFTVQAAAQRGLDFIAITDHNTVSHANAMRELQPYFDQLLLIPGREITTFTGHANLFGTTAPVDFRVGSKEVPDWNALLRAIAPLHGVISINHAVRPSGEVCMGCGWTAKPPADMSLVQAVEAVNGSDAGTAISGIPYWESQLARGYRLTAIGGSDNHEAFQNEARIGTNPTGVPATVVYAKELSMPAILDGIRAGHVFIDTEGSRDRLLELTGDAGGAKAIMGDALHVPAGASASFDVHVARAKGATLAVLLDGKPFAPAAEARIDGDDMRRAFTWKSDGKPHWLRAEVRDAAGKPLLVGNPVYLNPVGASR
jgi:hypothetical protein